MVRGVRRPRIGGAVYVLPNLVTTGNLFFGFFSIVKCLQGDFTWAGTAILLAMVFDMLDGRIARMTKGTSEFGVQYDSLCDLVSFGLAPAFLMYQFGLHELGRIGWIVCFLFLACGALRLARFNVQSAVGKASGDFTGLPIPMAAGVIACYVALTSDLKHSSFADVHFMSVILDTISREEWRKYWMVALGPALALLMVSNVAYRSHKSIRITSVKPFRLLVVAVLITALIAYEPEFAGFLLTLLYALSGPFEWILGWKKAADDDEFFAPIDDGLMVEPDVEESAIDDDDDGDEGGRVRSLLAADRGKSDASKGEER